MGSELDDNPALAKFLADLENMPWFANVGKPLPAGKTAKQLRGWEEWPGPEEPAIFELSERQQALHDALLAGAEKRRKDLSRLWEQVREIVFRRACLTVPYDPEQDAWHAPTSAVWQAAWAAALVAWSICLACPIPAELQEQWDWFARGHWPSGYTTVSAEDRVGPLLVY
jgi:hypothetical protein